MIENASNDDVLVLPSGHNTVSITVTYNPNLEDGRLIEQIKNLHENLYKIIIVDNASDNFDELSDNLFPFSDKIIYLRSKENLGIAGGMNLGIREFLRYTNAEWAIFLDQDTIIDNKNLKKMYEEIESIKEEHLDVIGLNYWRVRFSNKKLRNTKGIKRTSEIITSGTIVRRSVLRRIQLDESLFMYFVDTDFCKRVRHNGFNILLLREATMDHQEGKRRLKYGKEFYFVEMGSLYLIARNGILMLKRFGDFKAVLFSMLTLYMNIIAISRPFMNISYFFRGIITGIKGS